MFWGHSRVFPSAHLIREDHPHETKNGQLMLAGNNLCLQDWSKKSTWNVDLQLDQNNEPDLLPSCTGELQVQTVYHGEGERDE